MEREAGMDEDLGFKIVKDLGVHDEVLARAASLPIALAGPDRAGSASHQFYMSRSSSPMT